MFGAQGAPEVPPQLHCLNRVLPQGLSELGGVLSCMSAFLEAGASICELFQVWSLPTQEPYNIF